MFNKRGKSSLQRGFANYTQLRGEQNKITQLSQGTV